MRKPRRLPADDPREWLNRPRSDLAIARKRAKHIYLEDLCFHPQQAAEKAIKAVLIQWDETGPTRCGLGGTSCDGSKGDVMERGGPVERSLFRCPERRALRGGC